MLILFICRAVHQLFINRGVSAILNDVVIEIFFFLIQSLISITACTVMNLYCELMFARNPPISMNFLLLVATLMGFFVSLVTLKILSAAATTVFICFTENPTPFEVILIF